VLALEAGPAVLCCLFHHNIPEPPPIVAFLRIPALMQVSTVGQKTAVMWVTSDRDRRPRPTCCGSYG